MNLKNRVEKLQVRYSKDCTVIFPVLLDSRGAEFDQPPSNDEVSQLDFCGGSERVMVVRKRNESSQAFFARAYKEAEWRLRPTVILPTYIDWI